MIPDEIIREIRERAVILEVISDYVVLKKSGVNYLGLCPFHSEKTPSFNVNTAKGIYHCFGCGVGGDAISFIMRMEGLSFPEAVKFLARRVGVVIPERAEPAAEKRLRDERECLYEVHEIAGKFYEDLLRDGPAGAACRHYLEKRGVDAEMARLYGLGYAPDSWDSLTRFLERKKFPLAEAEKVGLVRSRERGGYYDGFRNRLLFPIRDVHGRIIGFGGRVLDDSLPKYLNSSESPVYHKSEVLFGLGMAKQAMREKGEAFIVEGYFDHLALYRAGVRNVVATCGTALTGGHLKLLRRFAGKAYLLFDADKAGKKATVRSMEIFLQENFPARVVQMPAGEDPDSYLEKYGCNAFAGLVAAAVPVFEFFFRDLCSQEDIGCVEGKVKVLEELAPRLRKIPDAVERDLYLREIARFLGIEENDVRRKMGKEESSRAPVRVPKERRKASAGAEEMLLSLMGKYPEVVRLVAEFGPAQIFRTEVLPVVENIIQHVAQKKRIDWSQLLDSVASSEERSRLAALFISEEHLEEMDVSKAFDQCRRTLDRIALQQIKELGLKLAQADPESDSYHDLLRRIDSLRAKKSLLT
ncbi:MAG: DNA primase [Deltaproteobacteria bacterium]|nr:DNA primase [Deltaproteobacteria bacterium]